MNEKEFKVLDCIYAAKEPLYFREIVNKTKLPYGTVQSIIRRYEYVLDARLRGKNKYYSIRSTIDSLDFLYILEVEKTRLFMKKHPELVPFIKKCVQMNIPMLIFGSFAWFQESKSSDLDIVVFSKKTIALPEHLCTYKLHIIAVNPEKIADFREEVLYKELYYNHLIISGFDFCLRVVRWKYFEDVLT